MTLGGLCAAVKRDAEAVTGEAAGHGVAAPAGIAFACAPLEAGGSIASVEESIAVCAGEAWTSLDLPVTLTFRVNKFLVKKESTKNQLHALYV
jgi:hypothetical protein